MSQSIQIYGKTGWIGNGDRPPETRGESTETPTVVDEAEWDAAGILMPVNVLEMLLQQKENRTTPDDAPEAGPDFLPPVGVWR